MSRREALGTGAAATTAYAALATSGCSAVPGLNVHGPAKRRALTDQEMTAFLEYFDRGLLEIERSTFVAGFAARFGCSPRSEEERHELAAKEAEFRGTVAALFASQSFRELPLESQLHPEVQRRLRSRIDSIDASVRRTRERLENLSLEQREAIHHALREHPDLSMAISQAVTEEAGRVGVSTARRRQFRAMMTDIALRMKSQGATRTLDEIAAHLRRLETPGSFHHQQAVALAQGDPVPFMGATSAEALQASSAYRALQPGRAFSERWAADPYAMNGRLAAAARSRFQKPGRGAPGRRRAGVSALHTSASTTERSRDAEAKKARRARRRDPLRRAHRVIRTGLILFGLGLLVTAIGVALVGGGSFGGVLLITPGAMSAAAGLIVLLVGSIQADKARSK